MKNPGRSQGRRKPAAPEDLPKVFCKSSGENPPSLTFRRFPAMVTDSCGRRSGLPPTFFCPLGAPYSEFMNSDLVSARLF